jgi:hypothetical protein
MNYQRMYIAVLPLDLPTGAETIIGVSHFEQGASTHIAEILEAKGFAPAKIGQLLDRVRVDEMKSRQLGATIRLRGMANHFFGRKA